ncbi:MAG: AI-2E family transporter [Oscillospiraceae bacterium]
MEINKYTIKKLSLIIFGAILFNWALGNISFVGHVFGTIWGYIFPFALGAGFAFLLNIPMRSVEKFLVTIGNKIVKNKSISQKKVRPFSIILTLLIVLGVLSGLTVVIIPQIGQAVLSLKSSIPYFVNLFNNVSEFVGENIPIFQQHVETINIDWGKIIEGISSMLQSFGENLINSSISVASSVFSGVINLFIAFIFAIYILVSKETLKRQFGELVNAYIKPDYSKKVAFVLDLTDSTFTKFFTGQCLDAVILGIMFFVGMTIFRFPYAAMVSALVSVTALIPVFGAFIACFVGAFLILVEDPMQAVWFIVFFLVMQQLEGNFIYPKVMGSSIGLPAIWVLVAVSVGASMMGIVGMILFIPIISVLYSLLRTSVKVRNSSMIEQSEIEKDEI